MAQPQNNLTPKQSLALAAKGFCMGIADVIPGISGGTIAFILGIYEELIYAIRSFDLNFLKLLFRLKFKEALAHVSWQFLGSVISGIACAILIFSHLISYLFEYYPVYVNSFFFGLILATIPIIALIIKRWTYTEVFCVLVAGISTYFLVAMAPLHTPDAAWFIFLCGFIGISAMILPGISGAFILVLLGKYHYIIYSVKSYDFITLFIFGAGILCGIVSFVRILGWLLSKWHDLTVAVLTGIVIGSLNKIWPWKETIETIYNEQGIAIPVEEINVVPVGITADVFVAMLLMAAGFILALVLNMSHKKETLNIKSKA